MFMEQEDGSQIPIPSYFIHPKRAFVQLFSFSVDNFFRLRLEKNGLTLDEHVHPFFRQSKKSHHVPGRKAYAAMGSRGAQQFRIVGAVDVNIAAPGIGVVRFQSVQPQNAGQDEVGMFIQTFRDGGGIATCRKA